MALNRPPYLYPTPGRVALVLAGGAARGAYELGVVQHIAEAVAADLGRDPPIDIFCGTSVGAINACALAALADAPRSRARKLVAQWQGLKMSDVVRLHPMHLMRFAASFLTTLPVSSDLRGKRYGGLIDPSGMEAIIKANISFPRITEHLRSGLLYGLSVSTTHIATGTTVVFVARGTEGVPKRWSRDRKLLVQRSELRIEHALASAAIPLMFPAVNIDGEFYCDGGLRQNVPLSPGRHLGADGLIVINPRYTYEIPLHVRQTAQKQRQLPGPWFLIGKALNALLLDRVENDIERLQRINSILLAGQRRYGPEFIEEINKTLAVKEPGRYLRPMAALLIDASANIGQLAAEYVRSPTFLAKNPGVLGTLLRRLAEDQYADESDLLSYVLFDGEFAAQLIELGRQDGRKNHAKLCRFFTELSPEQPDQGTGEP
jgi:NTE family protein